MLKQMTVTAGLTAALLLSGCYIERVTPAPVSYGDDYDYTNPYESSYGYGENGDDGGYGSYATPYPSPTPYYTTPTPTLTVRDSGNRKPILNALSANPSFLATPGQAITFLVGSYDPDQDPLQYTWSATGGVLSADSGQTVAWLPPQRAGVYTIQVMIADGRGGVVMGSQNVVVDDRGAATVGVVQAPPSARPTATPRPTPTPTPLPEEWAGEEPEDE